MWGISNPAPVILNLTAKSFNYVGRISNTPYISILLNAVVNVAVHNSRSEI